MAAILFFGSGVASILLPSPADTNRIVLVATGLPSVLIGVLDRFAPWGRLAAQGDAPAGTARLRNAGGRGVPGLRAARLGGDEFLLVLRRMGEHAEATLNRLADQWKATGSAVTFSAWVTAFDGDDLDLSPLERADEALYSAKRAGRNRVERASATADVAELAKA